MITLNKTTFKVIKDLAENIKDDLRFVAIKRYFIDKEDDKHTFHIGDRIMVINELVPLALNDIHNGISELVNSESGHQINITFEYIDDTGTIHPTPTTNYPAKEWVSKMLEQSKTGEFDDDLTTPFFDPTTKQARKYTLIELQIENDDFSYSAWFFVGSKSQNLMHKLSICQEFGIELSR